MGVFVFVLPYVDASDRSRMTPFRPFGPPSAADAGLSGESLSILEGELVGGVFWCCLCGVGSVWLVDVGQGDSVEQASGDEFGEADGRDIASALASGDAEQEIGNHCGEQLQ